MKRNLIFTFIFLTLIIMPALSQIKTLKKTPKLLTLAKPKIKVTGFAAYYGNAVYVSASITLEMNGRPLTKVRVRINDSLLRSQGNGTYNGAIVSPYRIRIGNKLVYTVEFPKTLYMASSPRPYTGKIVLGTYKIKNIVRWVWPQPGQTIPATLLRAYNFKWNFTGNPAPTEIFIKDKKTNTKIFSKILSTEQHNVNSRLFHPGRDYAMGIWASSPLGKFKLSKHCAPGSKIDWYFSNIMTFSTQRMLRRLIKK